MKTSKRNPNTLSKPVLLINGESSLEHSLNKNTNFLIHDEEYKIVKQEDPTADVSCDNLLKTENITRLDKKISKTEEPIVLLPPKTLVNQN